MITQVDNSETVYLVIERSYPFRKVFCNLEGIPAAVGHVTGPFRKPFVIKEWGNNQLKVVVTKAMNEMLSANNIDFKID